MMKNQDNFIQNCLTVYLVSRSLMSEEYLLLAAESKNEVDCSLLSGAAVKLNLSRFSLDVGILDSGSICGRGGGGGKGKSSPELNLRCNISDAKSVRL